MNVTVDLSNGSALPAPFDETCLEQWVQTTLGHASAESQPASPAQTFQLSVRLVDETESAELNGHYRGKNGPTNVLSFAPDLPEGVRNSLPFRPLGDLAICSAVVSREAEEQEKAVQAHWAHMVVHGVLHLIGMDHEHPEQAAAMEQLEIAILADLGFPDPYLLQQDAATSQTRHGSTAQP